MGFAFALANRRLELEQQRSLVAGARRRGKVRDAAGAGGPKLYMTDIFGHAEFLVPTPNYGCDPSFGPLIQ
jgi:hypothetical protein